MITPRQAVFNSPLPLFLARQSTLCMLNIQDARKPINAVDLYKWDNTSGLDHRQTSADN